MIIFLLILIVLILLFGAAVVKGWIGSIVTKGGVAVLLLAILTWLSVAFGRENIEIVMLVAGIALLCAVLYAQSDIGKGKCPRSRAGPPTPIGAMLKVWKEADRKAEEQAAIVTAKEEQLLTNARAAQAVMMGNPVQLSKEEKKRRKAAYKGRHH